MPVSMETLVVVSHKGGFQYCSQSHNFGDAVIKSLSLAFPFWLVEKQVAAPFWGCICRLLHLSEIMDCTPRWKAAYGVQISACPGSLI